MKQYLKRTLAYRYLTKIKGKHTGATEHETRQMHWSDLDAEIYPVFTMVRRGFMLGISGNKRVVVVGGIATILGAAMNALLPLIARMIANIFDGGATESTETAYLLGFLGNLVGEPNLQEVASITITAAIMVMLVMVVVVGRWLFDSLAQVSFEYFGRKIIEVIQVQVTRKVLEADIAWINNMHTGRIAQLVIGDVMSINELIKAAIVRVPTEVLRLLSLVVVMAVIDWRLTIIAIIAMPASALVQQLLSRKVAKTAQQVRNAVGAVNRELLESVGTIQVLRSFDRSANQVATIDSLSRNLTHQTMRLAFLQPIRRLVSEASFGAGVSAVIVALAMLGGNAGDLFGFFAAMFLAINPLRSIAALQFTIYQKQSEASRVFQLLEYTPSVHDDDNAKDLAISAGKIEFRDVSFGYGEERVISHLDLTVEGGETLAIVGKTGAGKSTLISLLVRFYDPDTGGIFIDGQNIKQVKQTSLRQAISLVTQDAILLDRTVEENITYGRDDYTQEEIDYVIEMAQLSDTLARCPNGLKTIIGERGIRLSGGEKQRISVARAILKRAPILLFDEATSALDSVTERRLQRAIIEHSPSSTKIIIAHRLSTIEGADRIIVLDAGSLVETGTHAELAQRDGHYARLLAAQTGD